MPKTQSIAWQGWRLQVPNDWNPVRIEGDHDKGSIILADLNEPRLALRWTRAGRRFDFARWPARVIAGELGASFVDKIRRLEPGEIPEGFQHASAFEDDDPPGRDIFLAHSIASGRLIELIHPIERVSKRLLADIVPTLRDTGADEATSWSIFDLRCTIPPGFGLDRHRLNAGDLTLTFGRKRRTLVIRQVAPASLALAREPLDRWLERHARLWRAHYGSKRRVFESLGTDETPLLRLSLPRRRRLFFARWLAPTRCILLRHDPRLDRILMLDGDDPGLLDEVMQSAI